MPLTLVRRAGESIIIDGDIRVTVVGIKPGQVRIAVQAPQDVTIDREEIHMRKMAEIQNER